MASAGGRAPLPSRVAERARLERAARLVERAPQVAGGDGAARAGGERRRRRSLDDARAHALGEREQLVVVARRARAGAARRRSGRCRPTRPPRRLVAQRARRARPRRRLGPRAAGCSTSTPTRSRSPNGSQPARELGPASSPRDHRGEHVAGEPALGVVGDAAAQQLERDDRDGLVQRQPVELGQRRRSSLAATSHACGAGPLAVAAPACARPAARARGRQLAAGREAAARAAAGALAQLGADGREPSSRSARVDARAREQLAARVEDQRACRRSATASAAATPSSPRSESTIRSSRSCAESARWSTAYCSLTRCVNAFSVIAMNGTS